MKVKRVISFKLGCDPELFLADSSGNLKASCGLIGGTKEAPMPITALGDGFAVQEDNVAIEFNIPPAENAREFTDRIARTMKVLGDGVNAGLGFHIVKQSAAYFPKEELTSEAAKTFGCDPDYNAWTGMVNPKPRADDETLRSCGGHVHVGYDKMLAGFSHLTMIQCMDLYLGVPSVLMDDGDLRKQLYGKAGAYRNKDYGVEYRTLSNFWVHDPKLSDWVWRQTERAIHAAANGFPIKKHEYDIVKTINSNDKNAAALMCKEMELEVLT